MEIRKIEGADDQVKPVAMGILASQENALDESPPGGLLHTLIFLSLLPAEAGSACWRCPLAEAFSQENIIASLGPQMATASFHELDGFTLLMLQSISASAWGISALRMSYRPISVSSSAAL